jgi:hypothetical protein
MLGFILGESAIAWGLNAVFANAAQCKSILAAAREKLCK